MAPQELIAHEACLIGIPADRTVCEANTDHASRVLKHYLQQKLTVWSELCHAPSAQQAALPGRNILF